MAIPSWLHIEPTSGDRPAEDKVVVSIQADAHTGRVDRRYTLTAKTTNGTTATLPISQTAKDAFITIDGVKFNSVDKPDTSGIYEIDTMPAAGANFTLDILVTSNCRDLCLQALSGSSITPLTDMLGEMSLYSSQTTYTEETLVEDWSQAGPTGTYGDNIPGDPGADAEYKYTIRITDIKENQTEKSRELQIYVRSLNSGGSQVSAENYIHIKQREGVKTYANPVATIKYNDIKASGSSATDLPIITDTKQTWGWNGNTSNGGTITTGFTYTYALADSSITTFTVNPSTGLIGGVASLGTTEKSKTTLGGVKVTVTANGKSSTVSPGIFQEANTVTYGPIVHNFRTEYQGEDGNGVVNVSSTKGSTQLMTLFADNEGGITYGISQTNTYTSGASARIMLNDAGKWADGTCTFTITTPVEGFSTTSLGIEYSENYSSQARNGCVVTITVDASKNGPNPLNPAKSTILVTFNQAAGGSTITLNPTTLTFVDAGGPEKLTITTNDGWTLS